MQEFGNLTKIVVIKKVLFIASHRKDRSPCQRFRFEQYFDVLEANGYQCTLSFLLNEEDDKLLYSKGNFHRKANILRKSYLIRLNDLRRADEFDVIFISREALLTRSSYFEKAFSRSSARVIYDFDDAIWMNDTSKANKLFSWMKNPSKISRSISYANIVFAGNAYLRDYALQFSTNVVVVPTTIDTELYLREEQNPEKQKVVIGWSGSLTTIVHFECAIPFLTEIKRKFGHRIEIKVIGDGSYVNKDLDIVGKAWNKADEVKELCEMDIGIMPLPDDAWARGKCGLKGLQYMALEIPTIMSPVGVNTEIIQDGENGFLARTTEEWVEKLERLIHDTELRKRIGKSARATVEEKYSVHANAPLYLKLFSSLFSDAE